jgi:hypothetical protein
MRCLSSCVGYQYFPGFFLSSINPSQVAFSPLFFDRNSLEFLSSNKMMLRYKESRYATRSTLQQKKATSGTLSDHTINPTNSKSLPPLLPAIPTNIKMAQSTRYPSRRISLESPCGRMSVIVNKGKPTKSNTSTEMLFEADDVSMGSISTHSSGFEDAQIASPTMMISPMPRVNNHSDSGNGKDQYGIPKTFATTTATITHSVVTPPKRISLGGMSYGSTMTFMTHRSAELMNASTNQSHGSAFVPVSPGTASDSTSIDVSPTAIATPVFDKAVMGQVTMKTPILEAATALMSLMYSSVMEDYRLEQQQQAPKVDSFFKPLDLSKGLDQDSPLSDDLPALDDTTTNDGDDEDDGDIDEEVAFLSKRRNQLSSTHRYGSRPSAKMSLKLMTRKAKASFSKTKLATKTSSVKKCTSKTFVPTSYKRVPSKFLNNPTILKEGMRLAAKGDKKNLNRLHCFVRKELLEVFVLDGSGDGQCRVGLRCVHCGCLPKEKRSGTSMSTFFPKSVEDLYRSVCTWQRIHFKACRHIPEDMKEEYWRLKDVDRTRGKKSHWIKTAMDMGFSNVDDDRSGVVWCPFINGDSQDNDNVMEQEFEEEFESDSCSDNEADDDEEEELLL